MKKNLIGLVKDDAPKLFFRPHINGQTRHRSSSLSPLEGVMPRCDTYPLLTPRFQLWGWVFSVLVSRHSSMGGVIKMKLGTQPN